MDIQDSRHSDCRRRARSQARTASKERGGTAPNSPRCVALPLHTLSGSASLRLGCIDARKRRRQRGATMSKRLSNQASSDGENVWVVILAADDGVAEADTEVSADQQGVAVAVASDVATPTQYRAADDGSGSPLEQVLRRAADLAPRERICVVVASEHREWWRRTLWFLPASNVFAVPLDEAGDPVLLGLRRIGTRDRSARVIVLPAGSAAEDAQAGVEILAETAAAQPRRSAGGLRPAGLGASY